MTRVLLASRSPITITVVHYAYIGSIFGSSRQVHCLTRDHAYDILMARTATCVLRRGRSTPSRVPLRRRVLLLATSGSMAETCLSPARSLGHGSLIVLRVIGSLCIGTSLDVT